MTVDASPRSEGCFAEDLDRLPEAPRHTELIDGALVFMTSPHYWRIEDESPDPVVHVYELDQPTRLYAPAGIFRHAMERPLPFPMSLNLDKLVPGGNG